MSSSPKPDSNITAVVARLEDFLAQYLADAEKLGITAGAEQVAAAIDEAIRRCQDNSPPAAVGETVEEVFLDGISVALVEERLGVYEKQKNADGEEVFLAVGDEVWVECLTALRKKLD